MKSRHAILAAVCLASLFAGPTVAQSVFTEISGVEIFALPGVTPPAGFPTLPPPQEGIVNCQGQAAPIGNPRSPCGDGVRGQVRGRVLYAYEIAPPLVGVSRIVSSFNFDENGEGPIWGTFEIVLAEGEGLIVGTYVGTVNVTNLAMTLKVLGHGQSGLVDGMQLKVDDEHPFPPIVPNPENVSIVGTLSGRLLNPGGKH